MGIKVRTQKPDRLLGGLDPRGYAFWTFPNGFYTVKDTGLTCLSSNGGGWEHVSVSCPGFNRLPTWEEMALVKDLFWFPDETVMQLHPPETDYVDNAPVLHLWKPLAQTIPLPPPSMVGIRGIGFEDLKAMQVGQKPRRKRKHKRKRR